MFAHQVADRTASLAEMTELDDEQVVTLLVSVGHLLRQSWAHQAQVTGGSGEWHAGLESQLKAAAHRGLNALRGRQLPDWTTFAGALSDLTSRVIGLVDSDTMVNSIVEESMTLAALRQPDHQKVDERLGLLNDADDLMSALVTLKVLGRPVSVEACLMDAGRIAQLIILDLNQPSRKKLATAVEETAREREFRHDIVGKILWLAIEDRQRDVLTPVMNGQVWLPWNQPTL